MTKLFDLGQYRKHLEDYYKYPCDKDKILERKQAIDSYSDEYLQKLIDNTEEFIMYLINKMNEENEIFENNRFTFIEIGEYNRYISNNCTGGWHADTLYKLVDLGYDFYISDYLLSEFLGTDSKIDEDNKEIDNYDDEYEMGCIYCIPRLHISIPNERFEEIVNEYNSDDVIKKIYSLTKK